DLVRGRRPWGLLRGLVQLLVALALLLWPGPGLGVLTLVVAATLVVDGGLGLAEGWRGRGVDRWATVLGRGARVLVGVPALVWRAVTLLGGAVALGVRPVLQGFRLLRRRRTGTARPARRLTGAVLAVVGALLLATVGVLVQRGHPQPDG